MDYEDIENLTNKTPEPVSPNLNAGLTLKERFRRTMYYQDVDLIPNFEFGYWEKTLELWRDQGLPEHIIDEATAYDYFGIESWVRVQANSNPMPVCEARTLEETDEYILAQDGFGIVTRINKAGHKSIPQHIDFPIKDRATWEPFKAALDPDAPDRWKDFESSIETVRNSSRPIGAIGGSMVGVPRNLIGFQGIAMMQYEDPDLLKEIVDAFGACTVAVLERVLPRVQVDFCMGWEDICFNQGPIISPSFFSEVVAPWYRRIADLLVTHGCCVYCTDCDGNVSPLVGIFLDHGMNTLFPVEVHGGTDPCALRTQFGKRLKLWGGVDKMMLLGSKKDIDAGLQRLLPFVEEGGFIPGVDHRVQADVPLSNYLYYLDRKRELFKVGGEPKY